MLLVKIILYSAKTELSVDVLEVPEWVSENWSFHINRHLASWKEYRGGKHKMNMTRKHLHNLAPAQSLPIWNKAILEQCQKTAKFTTENYI